MLNAFALLCWCFSAYSHFLNSFPRKAKWKLQSEIKQYYFLLSQQWQLARDQMYLSAVLENVSAWTRSAMDWKTAGTGQTNLLKSAVSI